MRRKERERERGYIIKVRFELQERLVEMTMWWEGFCIVRQKIEFKKNK